MVAVPFHSHEQHDESTCAMSVNSNGLHHVAPVSSVSKQEQQPTVMASTAHCIALLVLQPLCVCSGRTNIQNFKFIAVVALLLKIKTDNFKGLY